MDWKGPVPQLLKPWDHQCVGLLNFPDPVALKLLQCAHVSLACKTRHLASFFEVVDVVQWSTVGHDRSVAGGVGVPMSSNAGGYIRQGFTNLQFLTNISSF